MSVATKIQLNGREQREYSLSRAIMSEANKKMACLEQDVSQQIQRDLEITGGHGGIYVPTGLRSGLDSKTATKGPELVFGAPGPFIESLQKNSLVLKYGGTVLPNLKGDVDLPKLVTGASGTWMDENPLTAVAEMVVTTGKASLRLRTLTSLISYSRQLLAQSTPQIDQVLINDIGRANGVSLDKAALVGDGVLEPAGIFTLAGVGQTVAFAGALSHDKVVEMEQLIGDADGETGELAFIATPAVRAAGRKTAKSATLTEPIWSDSNRILGYRAGATTNIYNATADEALVLGVWSEVVVGEWGALEICFDPYSDKKAGMVELETYLFADIAFRHLESFAVSSGLTA